LSRTTSTVLGKLVASLTFCGMESIVFSTWITLPLPPFTG
jgi:hypothetical protein